MLMLMAGVVLLALLSGSLSLATAHTALILAGFVAAWLLLFAGRTALSGRGPRKHSHSH